MFLLLLGLLTAPPLDEAVRASMARNHVPGSVVAVVRRGQAPAVSGYGLADAAPGRSVDAGRTAFRTASVSKVITALVVSRLVEQGKLDPRTDVSRYLDFAVPAYAGQPVTLAHLLTHTAGLDDRYIGKSARSFETALPLGAYLRKALPARIVPPGEIFLYSNYGVALAGYIAERATGRPFARLAPELVFGPLGMERSSFGMVEGAATPQEWTGNGFRALPWDYLQDAPAGMQMSSGADMGRFVEWALEHGDRVEFRRQFTHHARLEGGVGWGWELGRARGHAFTGHDGGYPGAVARVRVFPDAGVGYFVAANAMSGAFLAEVADAVERQILGEAGAAPAPRPSRWNQDVAAFAGRYRDVRYSHDTLLKSGVLLGLLGGELEIGLASDGLITMPRLDGTLRRMAQTEPGVFQSLDDDYRCAFRRDGAGRVTHLFTGGISAMERVPAWLTAPVQRWLFAFLVVGLAALMVGRMRRWLAPGEAGRVAGWAANLFGFQLLGLGLALQVLPSPMERLSSYPYGLPWLIWVTQTLGVGGAACSAWYLVRWRAARWAAALLLAGYTAWLWEWRLLGYWW